MNKYSPRWRIPRWTPAAILLIAGTTSSLAAGPFGATFELSSLDGANGFVCRGAESQITFTRAVSVSGAGDINGDGIDDFIIGGSYAGAPTDGSYGYYSGQSYVVFGRDGDTPRSVDLIRLNGDNGFICQGTSAYDFSGVSVSGAGDVNGDGVDDLLIGADAAPNGQSFGKSYVIFGGAGVGASGTLELSSLNGANGFAINGVDPGDRSGHSVSNAGDINNDGMDDILIGAYRADANGLNSSGECYVVFGAAGIGASGSLELSSLNGADGFVICGIDADDRSASSVSDAGDVNGDGIDDLIIGASRAAPNGADSGESYVVFGDPAVGASGTLNLSALNGANGYVINGVNGGDNSGCTVSGAGDVNGDGIDDVIIGAYLADPNGPGSGQSYVVFGGAGVGADGALDLSTLNGANGFVCNGIAADDRSGRHVSRAGDINSDGIDDLIIGASFAAPNGASSGESYVVFGAAAIGAGGTIEFSALNGANGFVCYGIDADDRSGGPVAGAGDINGDGIDDLIIGSNPFEPGKYNEAPGESYIVFGRCAPPADLNKDCAVDAADLGMLIETFGGSGPIGDINGDGTVDTADLGIMISSFGD